MRALTCALLMVAALAAALAAVGKAVAARMELVADRGDVNWLVEQLITVH